MRPSVTQLTETFKDMDKQQITDEDIKKTYVPYENLNSSERLYKQPKKKTGEVQINEQMGIFRKRMKEWVERKRDRKKQLKQCRPYRLKLKKK